MAANDIVVGVDGSEGSALALRWAAKEAEARGWRLVPTLVWHYLDQRHADGADRFDPAYDEAAATATLRHHVDAVLGPDRVPDADLRVVCDRPASGLLTAAEGAALLVVGARGLGGFKGLVLGSVSQHCLHHATAPVAVVHEDASAPTGRVVVGVDGSENGTAALLWAVEQARATGARLDLVHAWHPPYVGGEPWAFSPLSYDDCRQVGERQLDRALEGVDLTGVATERVLVDGTGGAALVDASAGAAVVVVGARGVGGFAGLLLGSVSNQVARHAHCPVVVIPAAGAS